MKKLLCIIICTLMAFCFIGCKEKADGNEPPLMELMSRSLSDEIEFALIDSDGTVWLENDDVASVLIMYKKGQNRYLELRFTKDGTKRFKQAVKKNKKATLSITVDGEELIPVVTANQETPKYARADSTYEDVVSWFNELT